ncbi:MAG: glycosyltransferase family 39 protein [Nanoarchaeota archaeon]|nr:glycosyltransferase family 39 protein [Nanoarchaeota archaeon]
MKKNIIKQKISDFLDDRINLIFLLVFIFGLILRLKYLTINQAVWYDEAAYLGAAKNWVFGIPYQLHYVRPPLLPFIWAVFYKLGFGELTFRVIMLVFSLAGLWLTYLIGKLLFNKNVGLIAASITAFHYLNLFYTARLLTGIPSLTLWLFTVYFFWQGYVNKKGNYLYLMGLSLILCMLMRFPAGIIALVFLIYLVLTEGFKFIKNKKIWGSVGIFLAILIPYGLWYYITYSKLPILGASAFYKHQVLFQKSLSFMPGILMSKIPYVSDLFPQLGHFFVIALLIGLAIIVFNLVIGFDLLKKDKSLKKQLFVFLWIVVPFSYFAFYAGLVEDRYFFYIFPAFFIIIGWVFMKLNDMLKKYHKYLGVAIIMIIICMAAFGSQFNIVNTDQLTYADQLIKLKANSYIQFRQAGEWIKANSQAGDSIVASGEPLFAYYSERKVYSDWFQAKDGEEFYQHILEKRPKYVVLSSEGSPQWSYSWPQDNPDKAVPVQGYFLDAEKTKPIIVIYQLVYP